MRIAHVVASLADRHGGPSRSVFSLAEAQANAGHQVDLLTLAEAGHETVQGNLRIVSFPSSPPRRIASSAAMKRHWAEATYEVIHAHGLWLRPLHYAHMAARRLGAPLVLAPRGMMSGWAWQHHRLRKALANRWVHPGALAEASGWHTTSASESADIAALGFAQPTCLAPNGVHLPSADEQTRAAVYWRERVSVSPTTRIALFYSRFHQKKRVLELIDLWKELAPPNWLLLMVGIPDGYTVEELRIRAQRDAGSAGIQIEDGSGTPPPYAIADLFLLPTHSENFGLVVAESLAHGVPCLVSDGAPWSSLPNHGTGWWVTWNAFSSTLQNALRLSRSELQAMGRSGPPWMTRDFAWAESAQKLIEFYQSLHSPAAAPS